MLVICNGAYKSGSTWLYLIVKELLKLNDVNFNGEVYGKWQNKLNPTILFSDKSLRQALDAYGSGYEYYLSKSHLLDEDSYKLLNNTEKKIKVLFIERNTEDAVVSHYHHFMTEMGFKIPFKFYYWFIGRYKAKEIVSFENNRQKYLPNSLNIHFENLKSDFGKPVTEIANYLGFEISSDDIKVIKEKTRLKKLKQEAKKGKVQQYSKDSRKAAKHFRKGKVGESKKYFTRSQREDLQNIKENNLSLVFKCSYYLLFEFRRKLYRKKWFEE